MIFLSRPKCHQTSVIPSATYGWNTIYRQRWDIARSPVSPHFSSLRFVCFWLRSGADEVVLFERATFLVISHVTDKHHADVHRFEKISNMVKQFKLSVSKTGQEVMGMMVRYICLFFVVSNHDPPPLPRLSYDKVFSQNWCFFFFSHLSGRY